MVDELLRGHGVEDVLPLPGCGAIASAGGRVLRQWYAGAALHTVGPAAAASVSSSTHQASSNPRPRRPPSPSLLPPSPCPPSLPPWPPPARSSSAAAPARRRAHGGGVGGKRAFLTAGADDASAVRIPAPVRTCAVAVAAARLLLARGLLLFLAHRHGLVQLDHHCRLPFRDGGGVQPVRARLLLKLADESARAGRAGERAGDVEAATVQQCQRAADAAAASEHAKAVGAEPQVLDGVFERREVCAEPRAACTP